MDLEIEQGFSSFSRNVFTFSIIFDVFSKWNATKVWQNFENSSKYGKFCGENWIKPCPNSCSTHFLGCVAFNPFFGPSVRYPIFGYPTHIFTRPTLPRRFAIATHMCPNSQLGNLHTYSAFTILHFESITVLETVWLPQLHFFPFFVKLCKLHYLLQIAHLRVIPFCQAITFSTYWIWVF